MSAVYSLFDNSYVDGLLKSTDGTRKPLNPLNPFMKRPSKYLGPRNSLPDEFKAAGVDWHPSSYVDKIAMEHDLAYNAGHGKHDEGKIQRTADKAMISHLEKYAASTGLNKMWRIKACYSDPEYCLAKYGIKAKMGAENALKGVKKIAAKTLKQSLIPGFKKGGVTKKAGVIKVHAKEIVVPKRKKKSLR
jgi:hypothetical protein